MNNKLLHNDAKKLKMAGFDIDRILEHVEKEQEMESFIQKQKRQICELQN